MKKSVCQTQGTSRDMKIRFHLGADHLRSASQLLEQLRPVKLQGRMEEKHGLMESPQPLSSFLFVPSFTFYADDSQTYSPVPPPEAQKSQDGPQTELLVFCSVHAALTPNSSP